MLQKKFKTCLFTIATNQTQIQNIKINSKSNNNIRPFYLLHVYKDTELLYRVHRPLVWHYFLIGNLKLLICLNY